MIDGKKYSLEILKLVSGKQDGEIEFEGMPKESQILCEILNEPYKLPYFLETYYSMKIGDEQAFHFSLLRVQVDSDLRMNEDIQKHQQRSYVARTIEKLLYRDLMLEVMERVEFDVE
ncbi:MAG: hypothetical protein K0A90_03745 [Methanosarcinaceae archaeon]|nr:hypothetical protein [Methanosarcinaceae archaeon]